MSTILVTGGAGFIGSNFIRHILSAYPDDRIVNFDALTYAGNLANLADVEKNPRYTFVRGNICDRSAVDAVFAAHRPDAVVHFAAESHVDRSIDAPDVFLTTNILGTQTLLDVAKRHWKLFPDDKYSRAFRPGVRFIQVSTDEVYGALGPVGLFTEETPLSPNSPYSAAKAGADMTVRAYYETYGLPVNITRCSNNYGPCQFPEKLIPLMINNCRRDMPLPVYGDGLQIRDWLHVSDHCAAIDAVLRRGQPGEVYNIGGSSERTNLDIVRLILAAMDKPESLITHVKDRLGHDRRYAIDSGKIRRALGWQPRYSFEDGIRETIRWYLENTAWTDRIVSGAYMSYYEDMYGNRTLA